MNTIDRDAVIEECAKVCEGMFIGQHGGVRVASLRCADAIRALKSQPTAPDPRDEVIRLAKEVMLNSEPHTKYYTERRKEALAAIDALKGDN